jgi:ketosteroid isomerase-like protein
MTSGNDEIAARWETALLADITAIGELMAPDARIWHSNDGIWLTREESERRMAEGAIGADGSPLFDDVRAQPTRDGVLVQGRLAPAMSGGRPVHVVQVLTVNDGLVVSVEEYIAAQHAERG